MAQQTVDRPVSALSKLAVLPPISSSADVASCDSAKDSVEPLQPPSPIGANPANITDSNVEVFLQKKLALLRYLMAQKDLIENAVTYEVPARDLSYGTISQKNTSTENQKRLLGLFLTTGYFEFVISYWKGVALNDSSEWMKIPDDAKLLAQYNLLKYMLITVWNATDMGTLEFLKQFEAVLVPFYIEMLASPTMYNFVVSFHQTKTAKCILGSLHNLVRLYPDSRMRLRDNGVVSIVNRYASHRDLSCKTNAVLVLSYIVGESEQDKLAVTEKTLKHMISVLRACLDSTVPPHYSGIYGFEALEIVIGLNHIAVVDTNKEKLVECGILPLYERLLKADNLAEEQAAACKGLWTLAFNKESKQTIADMTTCMQDLRALVGSSNPEVRRAAEGALWAIEGEDKRVQQAQETSDCAKVPADEKQPDNGDVSAASSDITTCGRIMISYNWGVQSDVIKIVNRLKKARYQVWIDIEQMRGSTLDAMAGAIEQAPLVLIFFTENYKMSPNCRSEAEYCFKIRKPFIPIRMQHKYTADGWLGMILGTRFFYDFTRPEAWESNFANLCAEINEMMQADGEPSRFSGIKASKKVLPELSWSLTSPAPSSSDTVDAATARQSKVETWTNVDVRQWLHQHELESISDRFTGFSGKHILELRRTLQEAPAYYYHILEQRLQFSVLETITFTMILRLVC